jgi:3-deoxy-D-manno-octulosonic-acid transferase
MPLPPDGAERGRLAYALYDVAAAAFALPVLPLLLGRNSLSRLGERLGRLPPAAAALADRPLWLHAASVGESFAAAPLVEELRRRCPSLPLVVSTTTTAGRRVAELELRADVATLLPIDAWRIVDRVFARLRPRALLVVETEIWPGLLRAARRVGAPSALVSGRLSARSLGRYRLARSLFAAALDNMGAFAMQSSGDAERIIALGAAAERVRVTGNLKAARPVTVAEPPLGGLEGRRVVVAASTQEGEEEFALAACAPLWREFPDLLLVVAPRRPERFDAVARLLAGSDLPYARRSAMNGAIGGATRVLLLDTLGELASFYPHARAAFVGGTVAPLGGHNVLEPAAFGTAVAFGPHLDSVRDAATALGERGAGEAVRAPADLTCFWRAMLASPEAARARGELARTVARERSEAMAETWAFVAPRLGLPA